MRSFLMAAALALTVPSVGHAQTWIAVCNDGKNLQYNQTVGGAGLLYMRTDAGTYQVARMTQSFFNNIAICGAVNGNTPAGRPPITQICANQSRGIIYMKYQNPTQANAPVEDAGTFCSATVTIK